MLFGDVNPSGKLPYTVGKSLDDYGKGGQVMYFPNGAIPQQNFDEGLYIDYRHFDKVSTYFSKYRVSLIVPVAVQHRTKIRVWVWIVVYAILSLQHAGQDE